MYWCCTAASAGCHVSLRSAPHDRRIIPECTNTNASQSKPSVIIFSPIVIPLSAFAHTSVDTPTLQFAI